ncbi:hypothetical protein BDV59DRAFT_180718 [Aspergillus ambiguus]|uniref:fungal specific transcription factor domain-containing protein n=1 Tax=Aspergillus ambiguus TaxID=176160 RepID=UPI003CCDA4D5
MGEENDELNCKLTRLEKIVESFQQSNSGTSAPVTVDGQRSHTPTQHRQRPHSKHQKYGPAVRVAHHMSGEFGRMLKGEEMAYIRRRLGCQLVDMDSSYQREIHIGSPLDGDALYGRDPSPLIAGTTTAPLPSTGLFPSPTQVFILWDVYQEKVAPVVPIIHKPSFQSLLMETSASPETLSLDQRALCLAVFFSSLISMSNEHCIRDLDRSRHQL